MTAAATTSVGGLGQARRGKMLPRFRTDPLALAGAAIVLVVVLAVIFAPLLVPYDPTKIDPESRLQGPSAKHVLGTDHIGRDVFTRLLYGGRVSIGVALVVGAVSGVIGLLVGGVAGLGGKLIDETLMRVTDVFLSFPWLILAVAVGVAIGPSLWAAMMALSFVWWPGYARLVRGQVLGLRGIEYVEAARALGNREARILFRHVLPNVLG
ncbi:MAG: ABC transporter permease, partial [Armatimonadetes bacterium]|nr:ABC transporter permease [Armatimonadota bacterium]